MFLGSLLPLLRVIEELTREIELYEKVVIKKANTEYPERKAIVASLILSAY